MALFPPEFIAGVLFAFLQIRLRAFFSVASWLINGLTFFLPPEDELIHKLNGGPPPPPRTGGKSYGAAKPAPTPLSVEEKMRAFYINVAKTETGVFQQTIFFELYEMMVILATSTLVACSCSDALHYYFAWADSSLDATASGKAEISVYGLVSVLMICLWFPLQVKLAQGLDSYESKLGLSLGALGFIVSLYAVFAPKPLFDFDLEAAVALAGSRLEIVFRAIGFVDGDLDNLAPAAETLRIAAFANVGLACAIFTATSFLPAFRFARIYAELVRDKSTSLAKKALLHLNVILPLICAVCWVRPLTTDIVVPSYLVACSPRVLTRDCFVTPQDEAAFRATWFALTEAQWHSARLYLVWLTLAVRVVTFRDHLQFFLVEPKDAIVQLVRRPGPVDGELLKNKIRLQFNYAPIIAIQYLAPVGAIVAVLVLLARQTSTSLGIFDAGAALLMQCGVLAPRSLQWFSALPVLPLDTPPDVGGFRIGDDVNGEALKKFVKGMSDFSVVTPRVHASLLGFLLWWFTFAWFVMTVAGLVYWKNVPHGVSTTGLTDTLGSGVEIRRNRETPKLLKNQLKGLKMKKN